MIQVIESPEKYLNFTSDVVGYFLQDLNFYSYCRGDVVGMASVTFPPRVFPLLSCYHFSDSLLCKVPENCVIGLEKSFKSP